VFSSFLDKNFRRKLSYDQVLGILEISSVPPVDALAPPTLDTTTISNPQTKKYVQERDKELTSVQRSLLNDTGPLCCLHDAFESKETISNEDIMFMLEQALCLLGSVNYQLSVLRRKKVLAAIHKAKVNLGDLPLTNAKKMLFRR